MNGTPRYDDDRIMEFVLVRLQFSEITSPRSPPKFSHVADFRTSGVVMNIFLLDPVARLLSAFVWVSQSNTIGLFVLLDWDKSDYVFIDTGIECVRICFASLNLNSIVHIDHVIELVLHPPRRQHRDPL